MSRFLLFALLLYSSSDVISALLFKEPVEWPSCFRLPSNNPSPEVEEPSKLSVALSSVAVTSILSCPEFLAFSKARTIMDKNKKVL